MIHRNEKANRARRGFVVWEAGIASEPQKGVPENVGTEQAEK